MDLHHQIGALLASNLPLTIFVGSAIVILAVLRSARGLSGPPAPVAKPFMSRREEAMLGVLEEIFPMYRFHAQVAMGALLKSPARIGRRATPADRNAFAQKIVDFVVQDPTTPRTMRRATGCAMR